MPSFNNNTPTNSDEPAFLLETTQHTVTGTDQATDGDNESPTTRSGYKRPAELEQFRYKKLNEGIHSGGGRRAILRCEVRRCFDAGRQLLQQRFHTTRHLSPNERAKLPPPKKTSVPHPDVVAVKVTPNIVIA